MFFSRYAKAFSSFFALCLVIGALPFAGCKDTNDGTTANLAGTWTSESGDNFTVTTTTFAYTAGDPAWGMDFAGTIESGSDSLTSTSGYLVLCLTSSGSSNAFNADEYICIHWKGLTGTTVQQSGPYLPSGNNTGVATAAAAKTRFTVENGYFGFYGIYQKQ